MLTFSHFKKDKNQFQLIRYFIQDMTLAFYKNDSQTKFPIFLKPGKRSNVI
jgi:hypothetical protein